MSLNLSRVAGTAPTYYLELLEPELDSSDLEAMIAGYVETAVFTGHDWNGMPDPEGNPEPIDRTYSADDVTSFAMAQIREDCRSFLRGVGILASRYCARFPDRGMAGFGGDFHYTRNGHGTGFWDVSFADADVGFLRELTDLARPYGESELDSNGLGGIDYGVREDLEPSKLEPDPYGGPCRYCAATSYEDHSSGCPDGRCELTDLELGSR